MKTNRVSGVGAVLLALFAAQGLWGANVVGDLAAEQSRVRLKGRDVLTYSQAGVLTVNKATTFDVLLVGGGGGGGENSTSQRLQGGGGGGAGGVVHKRGIVVPPGTYAVSVGAGGAVGLNGGDTTFWELTAVGGGAGARNGGYPGKDGGSGGGSTLKPGTTDVKAAGQPAGGDNLGFPGGTASHQYGAGGGGGASEAGGTPSGTTTSTPGRGGDGYLCDIACTNIWYAGGGAGFRGDKTVAGGKGGGGLCAAGVSGAGADGFGGGGCGGSRGGSGVAIFSFVSESDGPDSDDFSLSGADELIPLLDDAVLVFRTSGTLKVEGSGTVEILAVGGGAGGGAGAMDVSRYASGGGGAGGVVHLKDVFLGAGTYSIVIGQGGEPGENGGLTEALGVLAFGGGAGATADTTHVGFDGASGGGAVNGFNVYTETSGGNAVYDLFGNRGNAGGGTVHTYGGGGGGGAGAPGVTPSGDMASTPGSGGDGYCCSITGKDVWYAGGGAAYRWDGNARNAFAKGGRGGGGTCVRLGETTYGPGAGVDGLGGGGSGGAKGGSGVVIIRYRKQAYVKVFDGAEGGVVTQRSNHRIHSFTEDGVFTMPTNGMVQVLLVGGGGGGGESRVGTLQDLQGGAGGGAGGVVYVTNLVLAAGAYSITVGAGGAVGANGENTAAFDLVAYGGGAGARFDGRGSTSITEPPYGRIGSSGGSGGGSTHASRPAETMQSEQVPGGTAIYAEAGNLGHDGGISTHVYGASGGGGAGGPGGDTSGSSGSLPGCGGIGFACAITGTERYYAGGGAGFRNKSQVDGGLGGGGSCALSADKTYSSAEAGVDGLGGGGSGGAKGGSGCVIVRYDFCDPLGLLFIVR